MKTAAAQIKLFASDAKKVRLALFVLTVALFVLAAGAPVCPGGIGG